jgi:hypothetical protein
MNENGFRKLYWGFFFILITFRLQGFDIFPDVAGYILFAIGFSTLAANSVYFTRARNYDIPMIVVSIFSIYQQPVQGGGIHLGPMWQLGILITIATFILSLLIVYNLIMGIKDMAQQRERMDYCEEADKRWNQYLIMQIASALAFIIIFIPFLSLIYVIVILIGFIALAVAMMGFMKRCGETLN